MVIIRNDFIEITKDDPSFFQIMMNLQFDYEGERAYYKNGRRMSYHYSEHIDMYINKDDSIFIQRGLLFLLEDYIKNSEVKYEENNDISYIFSINDFEHVDSILEGITLRNYQVLAVRKMCMLQRCIIQSPTGSGKTEIISSFLKLITNKLGYTPTTLLIEPTIQLVNSTIKRLNNYGLSAYSYSKERIVKENNIIVCHPKSLCNDLDKNNSLLKDLRILIADEVHHLKSISWRKPSKFMPNLQYSIGVSATAIDQSHINSKRIKEFSTDELYIIGTTGRLAMNVTPGILIDNGDLASPILFRMYNPANEFISQDLIGSWHEKVNVRLHSKFRNNTVIHTAKFFSSNNRKVLILVNTVKWSRDLLKLFYYNDIKDVIASYGGGRFEKYNGEDYVSDDSDVMNKYANDEFNILIGTTHMYEGIDVPNLDVIILAYGGKKDRVQLQGIGRALRKTKKGKYAYIVDFTDSEDNVLKKQSNIRFERYKNDLNIPEDRIFDNLETDEINNIFHKLEDLNE